MLLPKELVYKDRMTIDEFIDDDELNNDIYEVLLQVREPDSTLGRYVLKIPPVLVFNEAYYQATKAMHDKHPEEDFYSDYFYDAKSHLVRAYETDLILSITYVLVAAQADITRAQKRFLTCVENKIKDDKWYFPYFKQLVQKYADEGKTFHTQFEFAELDLSRLELINWKDETNQYNTLNIQAFVDFYDKTEDKLAVLDCIERHYLEDIKKDDWEYIFLPDINWNEQRRLYGFPEQ